ncbi:hypothetical protein BDR04DRAFT_1023880, partial [Suillus decipiens]
AEQCKAFALLQVSDVHTANNILREGLCIESERINVQKDKKEPIHCTKCQKFNHITKNCTSQQDTCGTCGEHCTSNCNSYHTTHCVNCHSQNHTSWNHSCPKFTKHLKEINEKFPENQIPYFLTEHAWTHVTLPPHPTNTTHTPTPTPYLPL